MLRLLVGALLFVAGAITEWWVEKDTPRFGIVQMAIAVLLFTSLVFVLAFWPVRWRFRRRR